MSESDWDRLQRIFHAALALVPERRDAYLKRACRGNAALKARLERMLKSADEDGFPLLAPNGAGAVRRRKRGQ